MKAKLPILKKFHADSEVLIIKRVMVSNLKDNVPMPTQFPAPSELAFGLCQSPRTGVGKFPLRNLQKRQNIWLGNNSQGEKSQIRFRSKPSKLEIQVQTTNLGKTLRSSLRVPLKEIHNKNCINTCSPL